MNETDRKLVKHSNNLLNLDTVAMCWDPVGEVLMSSPDSVRTRRGDGFFTGQ